MNPKSNSSSTIRLSDNQSMNIEVWGKDILLALLGYAIFFMKGFLETYTTGGGSWVWSSFWSFLLMVIVLTYFGYMGRLRAGLIFAAMNLNIFLIIVMVYFIYQSNKKLSKPIFIKFSLLSIFVGLVIGIGLLSLVQNVVEPYSNAEIEQAASYYENACRLNCEPISSATVYYFEWNEENQAVDCICSNEFDMVLSRKTLQKPI